MKRLKKVQARTAGRLDLPRTVWCPGRISYTPWKYFSLFFVSLFIAS